MGECSVGNLYSDRKGDSMINAGIHHGDLVLLRKVNIVENGQIAAVELDGNITLKRFRSMGSFVLLIPEMTNMSQ